MLKRSMVVLSIAALSVFMFAGVALAAPDTAAVTAVGVSALTLKDTFVEIATDVLPYAAALVAITVGWRLAKRFVRG